MSAAHSSEQLAKDLAQAEDDIERLRQENQDLWAQKHLDRQKTESMSSQMRAVASELGVYADQENEVREVLETMSQQLEKELRQKVEREKEHELRCARLKVDLAASNAGAKALQQEVSKLQDALATSEAEAEALRKELSELQAANRERDTAAERLRHLMPNVQRALAAAREANSARELEAQVASLREDLAEAKQRHASLEMHASTEHKLRGHAARLKRLVEAAQAQALSESTSADEDLRGQVASLTQQLAKHREVSEATASSEQNLQRQLESLTGELEEAKQQHASLEVRAAAEQDLRGHVATLEQRLAEAAQAQSVSEHASAEDDLRMQVASLNQQLVKQQEMSEEVASSEQNLRRQLESLNGDLAKQQEASESTASSEQNLRRQLESLNGELVEAKQHRDSLERHASTEQELRGRIATLEQRLAEAAQTQSASESASVEEDLRRLRGQVASLHEQLAKQQEASEAAASSEQNLQQQLQSLNGEMAKHREASEVTASSEQNLRRQLESLNAELAEAKQHHASLESHAIAEKELRGHVATLEQRLAEAAQAQSVSENESDTLNEQLAKHREASEVTASSEQTLWRQLESLNAELAEAKQHHASLESHAIAEKELRGHVATLEQRLAEAAQAQSVFENASANEDLRGQVASLNEQLAKHREASEVTASSEQNLRRQLESLNAELVEAKQHQSALEMERQTATVDDLLEQLKQLRIDNTASETRSREELRQRDEALADARLEIENLELGIARKDEEFYEKDVLFSGHKAKLDAEMAHTRQQLEDAEGALAKSQSEHAQVRESAGELQTQLGEHQKELDRLLLVERSTRAEVEMLSSELEASARTSQSLSESLRREHEVFTEHSEKQKEEVSISSGAAASSASELEEERKRAAQLEADHLRTREELSEHLAHDGAQEEHWQRQLSLMSRKLERAEVAAREKHTELEELDDRHADMHRQLQQMSRKLESAKADRDAAVHDTAAKVQEGLQREDVLQKQLDAALLASDQLRDQVGERNRELNSERKQKTQLEKQYKKVLTEWEEQTNALRLAEAEERLNERTAAVSSRSPTSSTRDVSPWLRVKEANKVGLLKPRWQVFGGNYHEQRALTGNKEEEPPPPSTPQSARTPRKPPVDALDLKLPERYVRATRRNEAPDRISKHWLTNSKLKSAPPAMVEMHEAGVVLPSIT
eukprot:TRINITY_DN1612_c0_g1_i2.p1 TRINITY_DN1612_c0_g1~~TRINITY_DN1612_c0_g1_i2.p1  ORF type:complete len:1184 (-),score=352.77 TRINITY_DN1612_c0_g1_i2:44-3595(-)